MCPQEYPLVPHQVCFYMFLQAAFMLHDQEVRILQGSGTSSGFLHQDFRVLNCSTGTSEHDPPLAPVTAQPALISHHIPHGMSVNKPSASLYLARASWQTRGRKREKGDGVLHWEKRETAETRAAHQQQNPFRSSLCTLLIRGFSSMNLTHTWSLRSSECASCNF